MLPFSLLHLVLVTVVKTHFDSGLAHTVLVTGETARLLPGRFQVSVSAVRAVLGTQFRDRDA